MIRLATIADLPWLRKLHTDFCAEYAQHSTYPGVDEEELDHFTVGLVHTLKNDPRFCLVVAEAEAQIVGYLGVGVLVRFIGKPNTVITPHWLYVDPAHRQQGLARQMAATALAWCREHHPDVTHVEIASRFGATPWTVWGFTPFTTYFHGTLASVEAFITNTKQAAPSNGTGKSRKAKMKPIGEESHG